MPFDDAGWPPRDFGHDGRGFNWKNFRLAATLGAVALTVFGATLAAPRLSGAKNTMLGLFNQAAIAMNVTGKPRLPPAVSLPPKAYTRFKGAQNAP